MKISISMDNFPMLLLNMMIQELSKHIDNIDIQVGGEDTVFVNFCSEDIVKVQIVAIICDKYRFGENIDPEERIIKNPT